MKTKPNHAPWLVLSAFLFITVQEATAWYSPSQQRWINRDPLGEEQDINLYCFVVNDPIRQLDPFGLALWKCTRSTDWGLGQHVYLWDDRNNTSCGRGGGPFKGRGMNKRRDRGPDKDTCVEIPHSAGLEQAVMNCCKKPRVHVFIPLANDCHDWFDDCLKDHGLPDPEIYGKFYGPDDLWRDYKRIIFIIGPWPGMPR